MLDSDSALHRLPAALHRRQKRMLDGIATSIDMATLSYARLQASLLECTLRVEHGQPQPRQPLADQHVNSARRHTV